MRIVACHVDGFGVLRDLRIDEVGPGTTVVLGPNESGKSTLQRFLAMTLVGYPRRNDAAGRRRHPPLHGGRHGGWVDVEDDRGGLWRVERVADRSPSLRVVRPDGEQLSGATAADDLVPPHVDLDRFEQVHAIDLDALTGLGRLDATSLDSLLYDAATVGAGRSLRTALDAARQRRDALWTPTATTRPVPRAVARRDRARDQLRRARADALATVGLRDEIDRVAARLADLEGRQQRTAAQHELLDRVLQAWPHHQRQRHAAARAAALPSRPVPAHVIEQAHAAAAARRTATAERRRIQQARAAAADELTDDPPLPAALAAVADEVVDAAARIGDHHDRVEALRAAEQDVVAARAVADEARAAIGPGWTDAAVAAVRTDAPTSEALDVAAAAVVDARRRADELAVQLARARAEHDHVAASAAGRPGRAAPPAGATTGPVDDPAAAGRGAPGGPGWTASAIGGLGAVVLLVGLGALAVVGPVAEAVAACLLGAAALAVVLAGRAARRPGVRGRRADRHTHRAAVEATARDRAGLAAALDAARDAVGDACDAWRDACRSAGLAAEDDPAVVRLRHRLITAAATALADVDSAVARRDRAAGRVAQDRDRIADLVTRAGLADRVGGDVATLRAAAARVRAASRTAAARAADRARARQLAADAHRAAAAERSATDQLTAALSRAGVDDLDQLEERRRLDQRRQEADDQYRTAAAALDVLLGEGRRGERARALLDEADPAGWTARRDLLAQRRAALATERDELLREQARLRDALDRACDDDAVPAAGQALDAAQARLDELARSWVVADAAARVLAQAVATHERDRHPRVLARAGALLGRATLGEWTVLRRLGDGLVAQRTDDALPVAAPQLSRGTQEQLYLCLRLALAGETARVDGTSMPVLVDDLGGATDPERSVGLARVLAATARRQQVWLFTCDPRTADVVVGQDSTARVLELARGGRLVGWRPPVDGMAGASPADAPGPDPAASRGAVGSAVRTTAGGAPPDAG